MLIRSYVAFVTSFSDKIWIFVFIHFHKRRLSISYCYNWSINVGYLYFYCGSLHFKHLADIAHPPSQIRKSRRKSMNLSSNDKEDNIKFDEDHDEQCTISINIFQSVHRSSASSIQPIDIQPSSTYRFLRYRKNGTWHSWLGQMWKIILIFLSQYIISMLNRL